MRAIGAKRDQDGHIYIDQLVSSGEREKPGGGAKRRERNRKGNGREEKRG